MRRIGTVLVVALTVLAAVALPVVGVQTASTAGFDGETTWGQTETTDASENETAEPAPGTRLAGSVGVQGAELGGELETRALNHQFNRSNSNASKAQVVAHQTNRSQARLAALRAERQELEAARANGTISENEYRVRVAQLSARTTALRQVVNRTAETAETLPPETLRRNGANVSTLRELRMEADRLTGPEVAAIARTLAGPTATRGSGFGPPENASRGGPSSAGGPDDAPGRSQNARGGDGEGPPARNETAPGNGGPNGNSSASGAGGPNGNPGGGNDNGGGGNESGGQGRGENADGNRGGEN